MKKNTAKWTIRSSYRFYDLGIKDLPNYRYLISCMVRRDLTALYKQTVLGPMWLIIQPILTTITFTFIFGSIAGISSDGLPRPLFYLSGLIVWNYFAECLIRTSTVFKDNAVLFGKVYFPRLTVPVSIAISLLGRFIIQLLLFCLCILIFYFKGLNFNFNITILLVPVVILLAAFQGMGIGMAIASLTIKYRDLNILIGFAMQLFMYVTPVIYPLSIAPVNIKWIVMANPLTAVIEIFRFAFFGIGSFNGMDLLRSALSSLVLLIIGLFAFQKAEKNFIDNI